jgi:hypothetical protein
LKKLVYKCIDDFIFEWILNEIELYL